MKTILRPLLLAIVLGIGTLALSGCDEGPNSDVEPAEITREAIGHYCNMIVVDHPGPKGQIHAEGANEPFWFSSVRDTIAFTRLEEETQRIDAIFVNDMTGFEDWSTPPDNWIRAEDAWYVVGSEKRGGMGAPEPVPFGKETAAHAFAETYGGTVYAFDTIPDDAILGTVDIEDEMQHDTMDHDTDESEQSHDTQ